LSYPVPSRHDASHIVLYNDDQSYFIGAAADLCSPRRSNVLKQYSPRKYSPRGSSPQARASSPRRIDLNISKNNRAIYRRKNPRPQRNYRLPEYTPIREEIPIKKGIESKDRNKIKNSREIPKKSVVVSNSRHTDKNNTIDYKRIELGIQKTMQIKPKHDSSKDHIIEVEEELKGLESRSLSLIYNLEKQLGRQSSELAEVKLKKPLSKNKLNKLIVNNKVQNGLHSNNTQTLCSCSLDMVDTQNELNGVNTKISPPVRTLSLATLSKDEDINFEAPTIHKRRMVVPGDVTARTIKRESVPDWGKRKVLPLLAGKKDLDPIDPLEWQIL